MSRLPLPDGPDRETVKAKVRAATLTGAPPASVHTYLCVTLSAAGEVLMASNADEPLLTALLQGLLASIADGLLDGDEAAPAGPAERPEHN